MLSGAFKKLEGTGEKQEGGGVRYLVFEIWTDPGAKPQGTKLSDQKTKTEDSRQGSRQQTEGGTVNACCKSKNIRGRSHDRQSQTNTRQGDNRQKTAETAVKSDRLVLFFNAFLAKI
jgi:hypothetical protein